MAKELKLQLERLSLRGKKIQLVPKLSKKHYEALRGRLRQPDKPAGN
jgi:hypothetical protein